jgi:hypothetical protein
VVFACGANVAHADTFLNGGFENGTASGWETGGGYRANFSNAQMVPTSFLPGAVNNTDLGTRSAIIDKSYVDPVIGAALGSTVYAGNYSYRAEDTTFGGYASVISQSITNYTDPNIFFAWKAVLENGGHTDDESAALFITLRDDTTGTVLINRFYNAGNGGGGVDSRFTSANNLFYTANWQIELLSIDASLKGHDFTLALLAADCEPTGHTGYAYLDGFGGAIPVPVLGAVPEPETYAMMFAGLGLMGIVARRRRKS